MIMGVTFFLFPEKKKNHTTSHGVIGEYRGESIGGVYIR